jgi:hypothetical protein
VVLAIFERDPEINAKEGGAKLCNKLFACIPGIAEFLASEVALQATLVPRPVSPETHGVDGANHSGNRVHFLFWKSSLPVL